MKIFDSVKDEWGYIDSLKESEDGKRILYCIQERAKNKQMNVNDYLIVSFGVRFSFTYSDVDYVSLVENDLLEFSKKYGCENVNHKFIEENDTRLLYRIVHLSRYFPCGSVTPSSVIEFFGYVSETKEKKFIDEQLTLKKIIYAFS